MPTFELTYGRVLVLKTSIVADNLGEARHIATELERQHKLSVSPVTISNPRVELDIVDDYEQLWEVEHSSDELYDSAAFTAADIASAALPSPGPWQPAGPEEQPIDAGIAPSEGADDEE